MTILKRLFDHLFVVLFAYAVAHNARAFQFPVGSKDGWVLNPSESYNHWAERLRFQVNDTLLFKYKKGTDSVLVVNQDDYDKCYTGKPILKLEDGNSVVELNHSGPLFFISGENSNCINGQKLIVVVMAVRNHRFPPTSPRPAPPPNGSLLAPAFPPAEHAPAPAIGSLNSPTETGSSSNSTPVVNEGGGGAPPRRSFATPECIPSVVLVSTASLLLNVCFIFKINVLF